MGMSSLSEGSLHRCGICHTKVTIEVAAPLSVMLNGDAAVLT
jgi:hypothetical protein